MTWTLTKSELDNETLLLNESLLSLGNGYLGVRGNFEEGYQEAYKSIRGTYINAFHDEIDIQYGEKLHGFPDIQQKIVNVIDGQTIQVLIDDEAFLCLREKSFTLNETYIWIRDLLNELFIGNRLKDKKYSSILKGSFLLSQRNCLRLM